ncbi:hypothetical protein [Gemella sanguinis]|uniref:hypothetical protein n=1 Tax=Gemella sanguinis TaxID=84135 RepID=UPI0004E210DF|nr:hypothetical protein [Gemella sanguinis]NKZ25399.1 hypothetical protein [Gemella sanguinis]
MKKQILAVMVGLSIVLSGCSFQSTESMLQEVKKDTKEVKSGKVTMMMKIENEKNGSSDISGYEESGDEKFDPLEFKRIGKTFRADKNHETEIYIKDGMYYNAINIGHKKLFFKDNATTDKKQAYSFKDRALIMKDGILNLLDNKDNWDVTKDGDKVTFKLKKTDELKNKVIEAHYDKVDEQKKSSEFDYTIEYVYNKKTKDIEKLVYELKTKSEGSNKRITTKGSLEEINKEVNIELPEESKSAIELKQKNTVLV